MGVSHLHPSILFAGEADNMVDHPILELGLVAAVEDGATIVDESYELGGGLRKSGVVSGEGISEHLEAENIVGVLSDRHACQHAQKLVDRLPEQPFIVHDTLTKPLGQ